MTTYPSTARSRAKIENFMVIVVRFFSVGCNLLFSVSFIFDLKIVFDDDVNDVVEFMGNSKNGGETEIRKTISHFRVVNTSHKINRVMEK